MLQISFEHDHRLIHSSTDTTQASETEPAGCWATDQGSTTCTENTFFRMKHSRKMVLIPEEEYARWTNASKQELTPTETSEGLKICAQSCPGERRLIQTEPTQKKITQLNPTKVKSTQTEPAISEKPIQNERGLKICAQSGSGERRLTQTGPIKKKITQTEQAKKKITQPGTNKRLPAGWLPF